MFVVVPMRLTQLDANARDQLVEREWFAQVVRRAEPETAQLRWEVGPSRDDHDGEVGKRGVEFAQDAESVQAREEQVEEDEIVGVAARALEAFGAVTCSVDGEAFGLEPSREEPEDPRFVLDDKDPHCPPTRP